MAAWPSDPRRTTGSGVRAITKSELRELASRGEGVVLVDRRSRGGDRPSMLHRVTCQWPRKTGAGTLLLYEASFGDALNWLVAHGGAEGEGWKRCVACGTVAATASTAAVRSHTASADSFHAGPEAHSPRAVGQPIWVTDRGRDIGWVSAVSDDSVEVASFESPGATKAMVRRVARGATSAFVPHDGDRCFVEDNGKWKASATTGYATGSDQLAGVRLEGVETQRPLTECRFRPLRALEDPLAELADHRPGVSSQYRARSRFSAAYWKMAEPSRGLLGVSSSAVELHPHQVGVARRVLSDPVQRYLLADEVGLGKTIEAGFVIRQRLLDAPGSVIVVLVPDALVWQWEVELEAKFALSELRRGGIEVVSFDAPRAFDRIQVPDLVVIDEAHRVAEGWNSGARELAERFDAARALARRVPRILLLSATPILHREADLLAMLHLLDPDTYRLENLEAFKQRVTDRERIGEMVLALRPGAPAFLLRSQLPELQSAFPNDERLVTLVARLASVADGDAQREAAISDVRAHLSDTYRLHRRLLRNRRSAIEGTSYAVRGRSGVHVLNDGDPRRGFVDEWLERWRVTLIDDAHDAGSQDALRHAADAFLVYLQCADRGP